MINSSECWYLLFIIIIRYRKLSRDVPQSPWEIDTQSSSKHSKTEEDSVPANSHTSLADGTDLVQRVRKGRNSVEEIIMEALQLCVGSSSSARMHCCGREDIDVRMLGLMFRPEFDSLIV